ncbi:heterokaryon incompatibility protein-domain-containing protein [Xylaria acuta]|nr:heterokaryon incompatibility protein-domain-containing protein [Xylaria acuta]
MFSYSLVPPSEEVLESSKDVFSDTFSLSLAFDEEMMEAQNVSIVNERSGFNNPTPSAKNLSLRHYIPCNIEMEEDVAIYHRRETIVDRGLLETYQSTVQSDLDYVSGSSNMNSPSTDAMEATLRQRYHYIWIDSLCIVQDSAEDWITESQRMGDYYSNVVCNLAASGASDDGSGCFADRSPFAVQPCIVRETWTNTSPQLTFYVHDSIHQYGRSVFGCELGNRGWVVQETLLAPRTRYFGYDQVFRDCLGHRACEAYPA